MDYDSLNVSGPHKLIGNDTIERYGFVEVGVALLEEVTPLCHLKGWVLGFAQTMLSVVDGSLIACGSISRTLSYLSSTMSNSMPPCPAMMIMY